MQNLLSNKCFHNEKAAYKFLEQIIWPDDPVCPHCGNTEKVYQLKGESTRIGLKKCGECRKQFTVKVGTIFESSHIPLNKWLQATYLLCASKKGMSTHQLHRILEVTYKTAWFMSHRIREAMIETDSDMMGGLGKAIQADETYIGQKKEKRTTTTSGRPFTKGGKTGPSNKMAVVGLVSDGKARMFHVDKANIQAVHEILANHAHPESELHTDESRLYTHAGTMFKEHKKVNHSKGQWINKGAHTNNIENYFSIFKRGMKGIYQHCSEKHLQRYLAEFDFRYNTRGIKDA